MRSIVLCRRVVSLMLIHLLKLCLQTWDCAKGTYYVVSQTRAFNVQRNFS